MSISELMWTKEPWSIHGQRWEAVRKSVKMYIWWRRWNRSVLEPLQAARVVEDGAFIGSRCIVVEGVRVKEAVLGANVVLTASTKLSMSPDETNRNQGYIPERSLVIPRSYTKSFPAGDTKFPAH